MADENRQHSLLDTTVPVLVPPAKELMERVDEYFASLLATNEVPSNASLATLSKNDVDVEMSGGSNTGPVPLPGAAYMDAMHKRAVPTFDGHNGKTLTHNSDVTYNAAGNVLVDLFYSLEKGIEAAKLARLLEEAWQADSQTTLKLIWNARSIHLGKGDREAFYHAIGWLYERHSSTLLINLEWLVRPVIAKKARTEEQKQAQQDKEEIVMINAEDAEEDFDLIGIEEPISKEDSPGKVNVEAPGDFEEKYGVSHGYWKDLLNIVAFAANDELKVDGNIQKILNPAKPPVKKSRHARKETRRRVRQANAQQTSDQIKRAPSEQQPWERNWEPGGDRRDRRETSHENVMSKLGTDAKYRALYVTVARLFAEQLKLDNARLSSSDTKERKLITLCGKWAPSHSGMHDKHTFIVSTIAEMLYEVDAVCPDADPADRTIYLKHARMAYQVQTLSKLRKHLNVVERAITENRFQDIIYDRVPSLAMQQYTNSVFAKKDAEGFDEYLDRVAEGKSRISGATLLPSVLVRRIRERHRTVPPTTVQQRVSVKVRKMEAKSIEGQWKTLVQRIKDSGKLSSSIAVCDVSGSMECNIDKDTTAMDASIGLSLLLAEVTEPPFGGAFITFSSNPAIVSVGGPEDRRSFQEKVRYIEGSNWSMSTDFVAVFEKLILPMAVEHNLRQEDMVKRVFVFSDMQFNAADDDPNRWSTSYERIKTHFERNGYTMPELVFWNLGGHMYHGRVPVSASEPGCSLVSGYNHAMLKVFMEGGDVENDDEAVLDDKNGDIRDTIHEKKERKDSLAMVKKAVGHCAYRMLKIID